MIQDWGTRLVLFLSLSSLTACDPCSGIVGCERAGVLNLEGSIAHTVSDVPMEGVSLILRPLPGDMAGFDSLVAVSDARGYFRFFGSLRRDAPIEVTITVAPPAHPSYEVPPLAVEPVRRRGDAVVLPRWVVDPYVAEVGELVDLRTLRPIGGAVVEFHWISGPPPAGGAWDGTVLRMRTESSGRFPLLRDGPVAGLGEIGGRLVVRIGARTFTFEGVRLRNTHVAYAPISIYRIGVDTSQASTVQVSLSAGIRDDARSIAPGSP